MESEISNFCEGAITRIKFENFVTYPSVEFRPGPHLNVLVGPNGSGKSSIVCGICLGLGGSPNLLGRGKTPADFIMHGQTRASIELELCNPNGDNYVIKRLIETSKSTWMVNNRAATLKSVEQTVARLGIQVDNLCQFLPQDKVSDFAKMTQQELLENTEKAVDSELYEAHQSLKADREKQREFEQVLSRTRDALKREVGLNAGLHQDVQNYELRREHITALDIRKKKRAWVDYHNSRDEYQRAKDEWKGYQTELNAMKELYAPLRQRHRAAEQEGERVSNLSAAKSEAIRIQTQAVEKAQRMIEDTAEQLQEIEDELTRGRQDEASRKRKLLDLYDQLRTLKGELAAVDTSVNIQGEIDRASEEMRRVNARMTAVQTDKEHIGRVVNDSRREMRGMEEEVRRLRDIGNQRLETLRAKHADTHRAVLWLRDNQALFHRTVHEPMMLTINCVNPAYAKYVEARISFNDMRAFMCETREDLNTFLSHTRGQFGLVVNAILMPDRPAASFQPDRNIGDYRQFGFFSYLRELFTCPEASMRYLCLMYNVHAIPVGTATTKDRIEEVLHACPEFRLIYTENHEYSFKQSRYSGERSSRQSMLRKPNLLTISIDNSRELEFTRKLQAAQAEVQKKEEEYKQLQESFKLLETEQNALRTEKKRLSDKKNELAHMANKIGMKEDSIKRLESEKIDMDAEERKAAVKKAAVYAKKGRHLTELKDATRKFLSLSTERVRLGIQRLMAQRLKASIEAELGNQAASLQQLEEKLRTANETAEEKKKLAGRKYADACRATDTQLNEPLQRDYERLFAQLPDGLEELDAAIHDLQARIDCTTSVNRSVVEDYDARKLRIAALESDLARHSGALERHRAELDDAKRRWIEPVRGLVARIGENYARFFDLMHCAGEASLNVPDNLDDYEKYGVCLRVKFRDTEPLRELNGYHQSGGERSVATVLYMMALQELTRCPFRCVDEINQGMDPTNERLVFEIVVETVTRTHQSQYFLLTPKLLPGLSYNENMMILCVYNGPHVLRYTNWNLDKFISRRRQFD